MIKTPNVFFFFFVVKSRCVYQWKLAVFASEVCCPKMILILLGKNSIPHIGLNIPPLILVNQKNVINLGENSSQYIGLQNGVCCILRSPVPCLLKVRKWTARSSCDPSSGVEATKPVLTGFCDSSARRVTMLWPIGLEHNFILLRAIVLIQYSPLQIKKKVL